MILNPLNTYFCQMVGSLISLVWNMKIFFWKNWKKQTIIFSVRWIIVWWRLREGEAGMGGDGQSGVKRGTPTIMSTLNNFFIKKYIKTDQQISTISCGWPYWHNLFITKDNVKKGVSATRLCSWPRTLFCLTCPCRSNIF